MDRIRLRRAALLVALVIVVVTASLAGCGLVPVMMYNMNPNDIPAAFDGLHGKRVVVACRPVVELQFSDSNVPGELTAEIGKKIVGKEHGLKIDLVDQREVAQWMDENNWQKFTELGKAFQSDMVIGVELENFKLYQGPTLLQGSATVRVVVYDMQNGGKQVFERNMPRVLYPPHTPIPSAEKSEGEFRRQFLTVLAEQISRHFYAHDSRADFATDAAL
jgi:hypothetical protein